MVIEGIAAAYYYPAAWTLTDPPFERIDIVAWVSSYRLLFRVLPSEFFPPQWTSAWPLAREPGSEGFPARALRIRLFLRSS